MTIKIHLLKFPDNTSCTKLSFSLIWALLGIFASFLVLGCAHDHKVKLNPEIFVRVSNIGKGEKLVVRVMDIRTQKAISRKESNLKVTSDRAINTVSIYASSNVRDTVSDKIMEGFERMGFNPSKHGKSSSRRIDVEISKLQLKYQRKTAGIDIPKIYARMETILRASARYGGQSYKKIYNTRLTKSNRILTGKFKNERLINNSLSLAIQKMFDDPELIQFLMPGKQ